jgi:hypothetical protein
MKTSASGRPFSNAFTGAKIASNYRITGADGINALFDIIR